MVGPLFSLWEEGGDDWYSWFVCFCFSMEGIFFFSPLPLSISTGLATFTSFPGTMKPTTQNQTEQKTSKLQIRDCVFLALFFFLGYANGRKNRSGKGEGTTKKRIQPGKTKCKKGIEKYGQIQPLAHVFFFFFLSLSLVQRLKRGIPSAPFCFTCLFLCVVHKALM